jgi:hypothetical protein
MVSRISSTAFQFSSTAFRFPRNPRKSIYGEKYTKDCYSSFVFFATRSPSFVIPAKQYLRLTQHSSTFHIDIEPTILYIQHKRERVQEQITEFPVLQRATAC